MADTDNEAAERVPSKADLVLLREVAKENVTWRSNVAGRESFRLWSSESGYTTCTKAAKRLVERGWVKQFQTWMFGRGGVELTPAGRAVLGRADLGSDGEACS